MHVNINTRNNIMSFVLFLLFLSACSPARAVPEIHIAPADGEVLAVQLRSTLWGIRAALAGKPSTMIMVKDSAYVFAWTIEDAWAFIGINIKTQDASVLTDAIHKGNLVNVKTFKDFSGYLQQNGYSVIKSTDVPQWITTALSSTGGWLNGIANSLVSVLVVPAGALYDENFYREWIDPTIPIQG